MNKRIEWLDFLKGLAIITVVYLHIHNGYDLEKNIIDYNVIKFFTSFHMPLFFMISGFLFNPDIKNYKEKIVKKCKTLLIPYIIYGIIIGFVLEIIRCYIQHHSIDIWQEIINILLLQKSYNAAWFIIVLFEIYILEYAISIIMHKTKKGYDGIINLILHVLLLIIFILIPYKITIFKVSYVLMGAFFFYAGYFIKKKNVTSSSTVIAIVMLIIGFVIQYLNGKVTFSELEFSNVYLFVIACLLINCALFIISSKIYKNSKVNKLKHIIENFGSNSIYILLTHGILINCIIRVLEKVLNMEIHTFPVLIAFPLILGIEYIAWVCIKIPKWIRNSFGKI